MTNQVNPAEFGGNLGMFMGGGEVYRYPFNSNFVYTEGVQYFLLHCGGGAYWFLDIVGTELADLQEQEEFMVVQMDVADGQAKLTAEDGNGRLLWERDIDYTDAFDGQWKFYLIDGVFLLPSEY